jgi:hypothetical protein
MAFSNEMIQKVWEKAKIAANNDPDVYRKDECNAWIKRDQYGKTGTLSYGWTIDHIRPEQKGGCNGLSNLRPLHWENKQSKSNGKLSCAVTSEEVRNKYVHSPTVRLNKCGNRITIMPFELEKESQTEI